MNKTEPSAKEPGLEWAEEGQKDCSPLGHTGMLSVNKHNPLLNQFWLHTENQFRMNLMGT